MKTNKTKIINLALSFMLSECSDYESFYNDCINDCDSHEKFESLCEKHDVSIWEPFELKDYEWIITEMQNNVDVLTKFTNELAQ